MMNSLCSLEPESWAVAHFKNCSLGDKRLSDRVVTMATHFARCQGRSIPETFASPAQVKAVYRFFDHDRVTPEALQAPHRELVREKAHCSSRETILFIEDSSDFIWAGNYDIKGLSRMGAPGVNGFILHSVLAVAWHKTKEQEDCRSMPMELLGLADQQYYLRTSKKTGKPWQERESQLWHNATEHIGEAPKDGPRWVRVCDRGADIYDFLHGCAQHGHGYVVRASQNRKLEDSPSLLFETVRQAPSMGTFSLELRGRAGQKARTVTLHVSSQSVTLASSPYRNCRAYNMPSVPLNVVRVWEQSGAQKKPLEWILLTDRACPDFATALECAQIYSGRWVIEDYHKCLKTGMGAERLQLQTYDRLKSAISILSIVALRLVDLRERVRFNADAPSCTSGLDEIELKMLSKWRGTPLETVYDVGMALGRLGGHMNRKADGFPGILTLWKGYRKLITMVEAYHLINSP